MRTTSKIMLFGLVAAGIGWWLDARRRRFSASETPSVDNLKTGIYRTSSVGATVGLVDDAYDATADAVASDDLDIAGDLETLGLDTDVAEADDLDGDDVGMTSRSYVDVNRVYAGTSDSGDLYGVHTPAASDTDLTAAEDEDGYRGAEVGENWFEALEVASAEGGPLPEAEIAVMDDEGGHSRTDRRDVPIADRGAGGPGGL